MEHVRQLSLDHIGIVVRSIDEALPRFESLLGAMGSGRERVEAQGVEVVFVGGSGARLELIEPIDAESAVARFLAKRGEGLHHVAYRVSDLSTELLRLERAGVRLIDRMPRAGAGNHQVAFIHPAAFDGVLVELVQHNGA